MELVQYVDGVRGLPAFGSARKLYAVVNADSAFEYRMQV